jgi:hypothetical protein
MAPTTLLLLSLALGLDAGALSALVGRPVWLANGLAEAALFHGPAVALGAWGCFRLLPEAYRRRPITVWALMLGTAGPMPVAGLAFAIAWALLFHLPRRPSAERQYHLGEAQTLTERLHEEPGATVTQSVLQILDGRQVELRRHAVLALRQVDAKQALPVLQKAIQDSDEQVRLLAQTHFNRIVSSLEIRVKQMEARLAAEPPQAMTLVHLAELHQEFVFLGLSSQESVVIQLERAMELLGRALELEPEHLSARFLLLRCQVRLRRMNEARASLERLESGGYSPDLLLPWRAELEYVQRNWAALRDVLVRMAGRRHTNPRMRELAAFWLEPIDADRGASEL